MNDIKCRIDQKVNLTLGADHWSPQQGNSVLAVTVKDTEEGALLLGLADMSNKRHTAINIKNEIERIMSNMNIEWKQIAAICTDSPSNMQLMKRHIQSKMNSNVLLN
jgi:hypothetical protein